MQEDDEIVYRERDARNAATRFLSTPEGLQRMKEQVEKRRINLIIQRKDVQADVRCGVPSCCVVAWKREWRGWAIASRVWLGVRQLKRTRLVLGQAKRDLAEVLKRSEWYHDGKPYDEHRYSTNATTASPTVPLTRASSAAGSTRCKISTVPSCSPRKTCVTGKGT